jgi:dienelactone hydrolase
MKRLFVFLFAWLVPAMAAGQSSQPIAPQTVDIPSGTLHLKGFLWKPAGPGPFPAVLFNHGRSYDPQQHTRDLTITAAAQILGPVFVKHGYTFLFLFRRGEGLSAGQGDFIGDVLDREGAAKGEEARLHMQVVLMSTDHLDDASSGLSFLKTLPEVDSRRIAVVGHSFGGQLTLLMAGRDPTLRAAVAFGPAANSWHRSPEFREPLIAAMRKTSIPVMLIHAANDHDTTPGTVLAAELDRLHKPYLLKIYPPFGESTSQGHNFLFADVPLWETDVFKFLDEHVKH